MKHTDSEILEAIKMNLKSVDLEKSLPGINDSSLDQFFNNVSSLLPKDYVKSVQKPDTGITLSNNGMTAIFIDGASDGAENGGIGILLKPQGQEDILISRYIGKATNNEAEYQSLIIAIEESLKNNFKDIEIYSDSELLVKQVNGQYKVKAANLRPLNAIVKKSITKFRKFSISWVPREENSIADDLAKKGSKL